MTKGKKKAVKGREKKERNKSDILWLKGKNMEEKHKREDNGKEKRENR